MSVHPLLTQAVEKAAIPAGRWLIKQFGLDFVLKRLESAVEGIGHRQKAILKARSLHDGRFGTVIIEDRVRWVVYAGDEPKAVFPDISGDLAQEMLHYDTSKLRAPDQLHSSRTRAWAQRQLVAFFARARRGGHESDETADDPGTPILASHSSRAASDNTFRTTTDTQDDDDEASPDPDGLTPIEATVGQRAFDAMIKRMPELLSQLSATPAAPLASRGEIPATPGIYVFSEGPTPLYVGNTRNLRQRLRQQTGTSSRENQAALAWRLALAEAQSRGMTVERTRSEMEADAQFSEFFRAARKRVRGMDVRFIEIDDPITRVMFELYAAQAVGTDEFNSFETH